jgi:hypothetical protein
MIFLDGGGDPDRWDRGLGFLSRCGGGSHAPLLQAGKAGLIDLAFTNVRDASVPFGKLKRAKRPTLVLLGDDDYQAGGPATWRCAEQVTGWCCGALIHGAGAERKHYEMAVMGTLVCGRFLMVDTASRYVPAWMAMLGHVHALAILPREGPHPLPMSRETMH